LFPPGDYTVLVEGENKDGRRETVGNYPFQIVRSR
jgi:hypothetical protein